MEKTMPYDITWKDKIKEDVTTSSFGHTYCYWWEDMRPIEVLDLIKQVYADGYEAGINNMKPMLLRYAIGQKWKCSDGKVRKITGAENLGYGKYYVDDS